MLEARLSAVLQASAAAAPKRPVTPSIQFTMPAPAARPVAPTPPAASADPAGDESVDVAEGVVPTATSSGAPEGGGFDESAESAFLAEARERGEVVKPPTTAAAEVEESEKKPLPKLDELVQRIPPEVRDVLEDLFRAKFVSVKRVPKKALKV